MKKAAVKTSSSGTISAKTVKKAIDCTTVSTPPKSKRVSMSHESAEITDFRFTKNMTQKRQAAKGETRKKGGTNYAELPEKKIQALANKMEAGPTDVA
jgi:hypothetical protein